MTLLDESFETWHQCVCNGEPLYCTLSPELSQCGGWTLSDKVVLLQAGSAPWSSPIPHQGMYFANLHGPSPQQISKTFQLVAGTSYTLSWHESKRAGKATKTLRVLVEATTLAEHLVTILNTPTTSGDKWTFWEIPFQATTASTKITFSSLAAATDGSIFLDGIRLMHGDAWCVFELCFVLNVCQQRVFLMITPRLVCHRNRLSHGHASDSSLRGRLHRQQRRTWTALHVSGGEFHGHLVDLHSYVALCSVGSSIHLARAFLWRLVVVILRCCVCGFALCTHIHTSRRVQMP